MSSFLVFESESVRYALPVESVDGIFWMPELSPIEAAPPWFVGLVNWHGQVVHVLDLGLRFKHRPRGYLPSTNIILVSTSAMRCGIIADAVLGLVEVSDGAIIRRDMVTPDGYDSSFSDLIKGEIKHDDVIVLLLNLQKLLTVQVGQAINYLEYPAVAVLTKPGAPQTDALLRARMHQLALPIIDNANQNKEGFALVIIGGIRYAIEIDFISEFTHLKQCAPLPCCPEHILGVINLRGEILSVIDMTSILNIQNIVDKKDIVVLQDGSKRIALAVQKVEDFQYFDRHLISNVQNVDDEHIRCKSLLRVGDGVAGILDIKAILNGTLLEINEQV